MTTTVNSAENNKVLLGLSGGVDSTAAALLLKEQGYDVTGFFFDVLGDQEDNIRDAERAARELSIPFLYRNVVKEFEEIVIRDFCDSYCSGRTPNPCVLCNPTIKLRFMEEEADRIGARYLATGHYAEIEYGKDGSCYYILTGKNSRKDQSYMLYRLSQGVLSRLLLPLGGFADKEDIRALVRDFGVYNADKKDSQEICFIREGNYIDFLTARGCFCKAGDFIGRDGEKLGRHKGLLHYTIGQRKGLGITFGKPTFVTKLEVEKNAVYLGDNDDLFCREVVAGNCCFSVEQALQAKSDSNSNMGRGHGIAAVSYKMSKDRTENDNIERVSDRIDQVWDELPSQYEGMPVLAKIRYAAAPSEAVLYDEGNGLVKAVFKEPQRAATPGQSIVFYDGRRVIGGGHIR